MRGILLIVLAVVVAGAAGLAVCSIAGLDPHMRQLLIAGGICGAASVLAIVPLMLVRGASQAAVSQVGLVSTIVHMFAAILLIGGAYAAGVKLEKPLLLWVLMFYWMTLIAVVMTLVRAVKVAPPGTLQNITTR